jgi:hypothetical protein
MKDSSPIHFQTSHMKETWGYVDFPCQRNVDLKNLLHIQPTSVLYESITETLL